jgi:hypothetical protein
MNFERVVRGGGGGFRRCKIISFVRYVFLVFFSQQLFLGFFFESNFFFFFSSGIRRTGFLGAFWLFLTILAIYV